MLTQETKRKIDSARQILVGKVPDPKAQVEQITTALIYKFMDDMDKEAQELGGKARFFTNGYQKYAWTKLMDAKLGGHERLDLYLEAITSLSRNPHIPQLFRDIFKDAFLPYRSPETLSMFLKEINSFTYEHSEDLGDAFEYLLSILGSQGDAGQFRTPRHIIDFIVAAVAPNKGETICDPACGTAGFLISAFKHILKENKEKSLTPDERKNLMDHFVGYDISPDMVRLSKVNLYLHGFPSPTIFEYDTLSSEEKWDENFDVMLANPPFMSPSGGIRPHKRFSVQANRSEVLFVDYILEHLRPNGRAGIIVPEGIIFQSATAYKALRKLLVEDGLLAVVSLPAGVFNPYAGVKTSILLFDNGLAKKTKEILFLKIQNDGYGLGAQRREIDKNDLPLALEIIKKYRAALKDSKKFGLSAEQAKIAHLVAKDKIAESGLPAPRPTTYVIRCDDESFYIGQTTNLANRWREHKRGLATWTIRHKPIEVIHYEEFNTTNEAIKREKELKTGFGRKWLKREYEAERLNKWNENTARQAGDYNLSGDRYIEAVNFVNQKWPLVELGELEKQKKITFLRGQGISKKDIIDKGKNKCIHYGEIYTLYQPVIKEVISRTNCEGKILSKKGDVLVPSTTTADALGIAVARSLNENRIILGGDINIIRTENKYLLSDYIAYLISNSIVKKQLATFAKGVNILHLSNSDLRKLKIPLPPIEVQNEIVEQIEKYQNIVDGAKQIINNYKPTIKVDSSWQIIELGNLFLDTKLGLVKDKSMQADVFPYPYIKMENISIDGNLELNSVVHVEANNEELEKYTLNDGDFIYNTRNAPNLVGKSTVYHGENGKYLFNNNILRIRFRKEADPDYINYYLNTEEGKQKIKTLVSGTTSVAAIYQKNFATITVPLPPIEVQKEIVAEITKEKEWVLTSVKIIDIFEKKISQLINDIL